MPLEEKSFMDYWTEIDQAMTRLYGIDTGDAGIEVELIASAEQDAQDPEEFAIWFGEKYGLVTISGFGGQS